MDVTDVDGFGSSELITGTSNGSIFLLNDSKNHRKTDSAVTQILVVSKDLVLAFYDRVNGKRSASAYHTFNLEQIQGLTLHECCGGTVIGENVVAVFTAAAIRILKFDVPRSGAPQAKLIKTIELKGTVGAIAALRSLASSSLSRSRTLFVASDSEYKLCDLKTGLITPLFPIMPGLTPLMCTVGSDFVVVQGTKQDEPAMGLFVDTKGEVSRQGAVLQWDRYPSSITATSDYILAVVNEHLVVHKVTNGSVEQVPCDENCVKFVKRLNYGVPVINNELLVRLGEKTISCTKAECVVVYQSDECNIKPWTPPETPSLVLVENKIEKGEINTIEPDPKLANTEQGVVELKYLSEYLILHQIANDRVEQALKAWHSYSQLDHELVLYMLTDSIKVKPSFFPGLEKLVNSIKKNKGGANGSKFLVAYLKSKIKILRQNPSTAYTSAKLCEVIYAKHLNSQDLIVRFLLERDLQSRDEIIEWLKSTHQYPVLIDYWSLSNNKSSLSSLYLGIISNPNQPENKRLVKTAVSELAGPLAEYTDLWEVVTAFVNLPKIPLEYLMNILRSSKFSERYSPTETLEMLKQATDSGEAWRSYLKYLVHTKGMFQNDLATLIVADIIDISVKYKKDVELSYENFEQINWPKPPYREWLMSLRGYPEKLLELQTDFWSLLSNGTLECSHLLTTFGERLPHLKTELASIYRGLGLHEQALEILYSIKDFCSIIDYCNNVYDDAKLQEDLAAVCLRCIANEPSVVKDYLEANQPFLQAETVLKIVPSNTPAHIVTQFLSAKLVLIQEEVQHSQAMYVINKAFCK